MLADSRNSHVHASLYAVSSEICAFRTRPCFVIISARLNQVSARALYCNCSGSYSRAQRRFELPTHPILKYNKEQVLAIH